MDINPVKQRAGNPGNVILDLARCTVTLFFGSVLYPHKQGCVAFLPYYAENSKTASKCCPTTLKTIGDLLRKRRLYLELFQKDVAKKLGVCEPSTYSWENFLAGPAIKYIHLNILEWVCKRG